VSEPTREDGDFLANLLGGLEGVPAAPSGTIKQEPGLAQNSVKPEPQVSGSDRLRFFGGRWRSLDGGAPAAPKARGVPVPARGAKEKKGEKNAPTYLPAFFFSDFLSFSGLVLENIFMVFWGSSCRETAKNAIKQVDGDDDRKKVFFLAFSAKSF
jgi:hypothetical protein